MFVDLVLGTVEPLAATPAAVRHQADYAHQPVDHAVRHRTPDVRPTTVRTARGLLRLTGIGFHDQTLSVAGRTTGRTRWLLPRTAVRRGHPDRWGWTPPAAGRKLHLAAASRR